MISELKLRKMHRVNCTGSLGGYIGVPASGKHKYSIVLRQ